jgi:hypothetical protein
LPTKCLSELGKLLEFADAIDTGLLIPQQFPIQTKIRAKLDGDNKSAVHYWAFVRFFALVFPKSNK